MKTIVTIFVAIFVSNVLYAGVDQDRLIQKVKLPSGQLAVVAEGDYEPRSLGSYSVRLYSGENAQFPLDDFVAGIIKKRDNGAIEQVKLADIDGDGHIEIVVIIRCVGTGQYLSADAFAVEKKRLMLRASVADLAPNADPIAALKKAQLNSK